VYQEGSTQLPDNVIIQWWNWLGKKDLALKNAIKNGHQVICNTSHKTYLNYPLSPWKMYSQKKTFDLKDAYEENPSHIENPDKMILGMGACLWTNRGVLENMIDQRVFPRIFALSEQMWCKKPLISFDEFYRKVKSKYPLMDLLGIQYGPALKKTAS
ncbi:MAG: family 20 glycosylhydrolase, partial [Bacteroidales bacterium]|nr:family 20 glycosylhydrolase [Bacteroidales bacterium]